MSESSDKSTSAQTGKGKVADINDSSKEPAAGKEDKKSTRNDGHGGSVLADVNDDSKDKSSKE